MKKQFILLVFFSLFLLNNSNAQLTIRALLNTAKAGGKTNIGNDRPDDDPNSNTSMGIYGLGTDPYRIGGRIHFGDFSTAAYAYIGEYGNSDSDALELHGSNGVRFTNGTGIATQLAGEMLGDGTLKWYSSISATVFNTTSDIRLKKNVTNVSSSLSNLMLLKPIKYDLTNPKYDAMKAELDKQVAKDDKAKASLDKAKANLEKVKEVKNQYGFSAQDVQKIYPEVVMIGEDGYLAINYTALVPLVIQSIQEQQKQITDLQAQVKLLMAEVEKLKAK